jgi:predicted aldo/keto reductase-like oxidoreductase
MRERPVAGQKKREMERRSMRYTKFGKIGFEVSSLGFGAMNLPGVPLEQARAALNYALDAGINYVDTAAAYRNSEEIIGECISHRRQDYFLATKTAARDYETAKSEIERSLVRMKTDHIDLLQIHYVNYPQEYERVLAEDGAYRAALEAKEAGKIRFIGITGHRPELLARWVKSGLFDQALFHLNLSQPFAREDLIPELNRQNMGIVAMKPMSGGFIQPVEKAIRYPFSQDVHVTLSGMVSVEEVKENLAAQEREVEEPERLQLVKLAEELGTHNCRRCNYCSCPLEIPIPDVMISSRIRSTFGLLPKGEAFYEKHRDKLFSCSDYEPCQEAPLCQQKCPYHLPIRREIMDSTGYFSEQSLNS